MDTIIDEIVSIEKIECTSKRYDIEVEDNHNFFANDILVHNCQNLSNEWEDIQNEDWFVTEKVDGTSFTCYIKGDEFGVCSRNMDLKETDGNTHWKVARALGLEEKMRDMRESFGQVDFAIQAELLGEGIQKKPIQYKGSRHLRF